jgi:hypothetical protein
LESISENVDGMELEMTGFTSEEDFTVLSEEQPNRTIQNAMINDKFFNILSK